MQMYLIHTFSSSNSVIFPTLYPCSFNFVIIVSKASVVDEVGCINTIAPDVFFSLLSAIVHLAQVASNQLYQQST